jgi:hypothetical protein
MRTNVYVDGFNLYYGCLRRTAYKCLDLDALCRNALARHHVINRIRYFTVLVKSAPSNPDQHVRQQAYIRALKTIPHLTVRRLRGAHSERGWKGHVHFAGCGRAPDQPRTAATRKVCFRKGRLAPSLRRRAWLVDDTSYTVGRFDHRLKLTSAVSHNEIPRYRACLARFG